MEKQIQKKIQHKHDKKLHERHPHKNNYTRREPKKIDAKRKKAQYFPEMEKWDAYDRDFKKIPNVTLVRGKPLVENVFHLVTDIITQHIDGEYLITQRDFCKNFGGMWELSSGGSALSGESAKECAIRELKEETGICESQIIEFIELGRVIDEKAHSIYVEFFCKTNCDKNKIKLQTGETINFKWVPKDFIRAMSKTELLTHRIQRFMEDF